MWISRAKLCWSFSKKRYSECTCSSPLARSNTSCPLFTLSLAIQDWAGVARLTDEITGKGLEENAELNWYGPHHRVCEELQRTTGRHVAMMALDLSFSSMPQSRESGKGSPFYKVGLALELIELRKSTVRRPAHPNTHHTVVLTILLAE